MRWAAAAFFVAALVSTIVFNVPINLATGKWDVENLPEDWKKIRDRWEGSKGLDLGYYFWASHVYASPFPLDTKEAEQNPWSQR